jgi:hypothetical protein
VFVARFGCNPSTTDPLATVVRCKTAASAPTTETLGDTLTDDCRFVDATPADGMGHHGCDAVLAVFAKLFSTNPSALLSEIEGGLACGDRVVLEWRPDWREDGDGHVRGVDLFTLQAGRGSDVQSLREGLIRSPTCATQHTSGHSRETRPYDRMSGSWRDEARWT